MTQELKPTVRRDLSLVSVQAWQQGYGKSLQETLGWYYPCVFHYDGTTVRFYHRQTDFQYFKTTITRQLIEDRELFERLNTLFQGHVRKLKQLLTRFNRDNFLEAYTLIGKIMSFYIFVVSDTFLAAVPAAQTSRYMSEGILYEADTALERLLRQELVGHSFEADLAHVLTISEAQELMEGGLQLAPSLDARQHGYILENDLIVPETDFVVFCAHRQFLNPEAIVPSGILELSGQSAFPGLSRGQVKIVAGHQDFDKMDRGNIVVCSMTNVNYLPVLRQAAAIITDEGGITCHAAIVARELKKPCIVGTKIATKVLQDGDVVEVDADRGLVTILKRA